MFIYIITFIAVFATDLLYIFFVKSIQNNRPFMAGVWSMLVTLTASIAVINYTEDHFALIPALLGAFCGAYFGLLYKNRNKNN